MVRRVVFGFPRTIYEFGEREKGFLDPWSSLKPSFLRYKIAPEILGIFRKKAGGLTFESFFKIKGNFVDSKQINDQWTLVFPKRTYLPPSYPHLQLWLLSQNYMPSPKFASKKELEILAEAVSEIYSVFRDYSQQNKKPGRVAFGYNSTPFSFIKDNLGRYYAGGQSVRVLHIHCLLIPKPKKMLVSKQDLFLVYPTSFSLSLFKLIFFNKRIVKSLGFSSKERIKVDKRGIVIESFQTNKDSLLRLWQIIRRMDELLYKLQCVLVCSFYQDAQKFVERLDFLSRHKDLSEAKKILSKLIVVGKERSLKEIKQSLSEGLQKLAGDFESSFSSSNLEKLTEQLVINERGDLSSFVFDERVVLRPGMGYSVLLEENRRGKIRMRVNPLDVLGSKGLIESSGYWFERKIIKHRYPSWAWLIVGELVKRLG